MHVAKKLKNSVRNEWKKMLFQYREKYIMNSDIKRQRVRDQYEKDPETKKYDVYKKELESKRYIKKKMFLIKVLSLKKTH